MPLHVLRWSLALVLGAGAVLLLIHGHPAIAPPAAIAIAATELAGAALFVMPRTQRLGALALVGSLAAAAVVHVALGQPPPPAFAVYAAAIWVVTSRRREAVA